MRNRLVPIILNYKTPDLTIACLTSMKGEIDVGRDLVLVVDNDSRDGSAERIAEAIEKNNFGDWARLLRSPRNGGFAFGNNHGIRAADAEAYILVNSDTLVRPGAIAELYRAMQLRPDAGLIGPRMEYGDGTNAPSCFRDTNPVTEFLRASGTGLIPQISRWFEFNVRPFDTPVEVDWLGFAFVLIRREVIEQVGLLDEGYFMYYEDMDYCRRVRQAGWKILHWPDAKIVHFLGGSSKISEAQDKSAKPRPRYFYEARARYFKKHFGQSGLGLANAAFTIGRGVSIAREKLGRTRPHTYAREERDIWIDFLRPSRD
jgi:N-acetylglucosaminyl-diphospho-decaprenol L-rhamnosyltransferase